VASVKGPIEIEQLLTKSNVITEMAERSAAPTMTYERRETCQLLSKCAGPTLRTHRYKAALEACERCNRGRNVDLARVSWHDVTME
jgi:hypothetical protein